MALKGRADKGRDTIVLYLNNSNKKSLLLTHILYKPKQQFESKKEGVKLLLPGEKARIYSSLFLEVVIIMKLFLQVLYLL